MAAKQSKRTENKKKLKKSSKKEKEKFFVGNFLKQPARTRSGTRYSRKKRKSSSENIFGSLVSCNNTSSKNSLKIFKSMSKDKIKCRCKECKLLKQKISESECRSSKKGFEMLLQNPINAIPHASEGVAEPKKRPKKKKSSTYFCTCDLCSHKSDGRQRKQKRKRKNKASTASGSSKILDLRKFVLKKTKSKSKTSHCHCCNCSSGKSKPKTHKSMPSASAGLVNCDSDYSGSSEDQQKPHHFFAPFPSAGKAKKTPVKKKPSAIKKKPKKSSASNKNNKKSASKKKKADKQIAPMPSAHPTDKTDDNYQKIQQAPAPSAWEVDELKRELAKQGVVSYNDAPVPSGTVPTYIAMVKTAIRDLKPFRVTNFDAISKYIRIRYHIRNDDLLEYILKWMIEMGVVKKHHGHYKFTKKRLVKKETVAVLRKRGKRRRKRKSKKRKRKNKRKGRKKRKSKKNRDYKIIDILGGKKKKKRKKQKKKKAGKCTCSKELDSKKNRIKVKTKYVRRNGKIYKYDEYI